MIINKRRIIPPIPVRIYIRAIVFSFSEISFIKIISRKLGLTYHFRYFINLLPFRIKKTEPRKGIEKAKIISADSLKILIITKIKITKSTPMKIHLNLLEIIFVFSN
jgi:hypothetical protein